MRIDRILGLYAALSLLFLTTLGCGSGQAPARYTIGMSQCNLGEPWRVQMDADLKAAVKKHNEQADATLDKSQYSKDIEIVFKNAQNETLTQVAHVEEFVAAEVDLLIVSPLEGVPLTESVAAAYEAGIPVIVLDRELVGKKYTCFIGGDNVEIGRLVGKWLIDELGGKGRVVELKGLMTSSPAQDRHQGFREAIAGSELEIIFEADMKWLEPDARNEMDSALAVHDHIDAVYGHNDPGAHGAYSATEAAGRTDEMLFVGVDALPHEGIAYVKQGVLDATFQYPTLGFEAIETAARILAGENVDKRMILGTRIYTAENVDQGGEAIVAAVPETDQSDAAEE